MYNLQPTKMHVKKALFIVIFSLPHLFAAPIHGGLRRVLVVAKTVAASSSNIVSVHAVQKHIPAFDNVASSSIPVSAARGSSLNLVAQFPTSFQPPTLPPATGDFGAARIQWDKRVSTTRSSSEHSDVVGTVMEFHPDGTNGRDEKTTKKAIIGDFIASGGAGSVYSVASHEFGDHELVAKRFANYHGFRGPTLSMMEETQNLRRLGQLRGSITRKGQTWILMDKILGQHLEDTEAYKAAKLLGQSAVDQVLALAAKLVSIARFDYADKYDLVHTDLHHGNIKYEEHDGKLSRAYLLDWGRADPAPQKGPNGKFTLAQADDIRHLSKAIPLKKFLGKGSSSLTLTYSRDDD